MEFGRNDLWPAVAYYFTAALVFGKHYPAVVDLCSKTSGHLNCVTGKGEEKKENCDRGGGTILK